MAYKQKDVSAADLLGPEPDAAEIPVTGDARVEQSDIEAGKDLDMAYAEELGFLEEKVTIIVLPSDKDDDPRLIPIGVNGKTQHIIVGRPQKVRRKYVNVLAQAKRRRYKQQVGRDASTGLEYNRMQPRTVPRYNFSVIHDPSGEKGALWLQDVMRDMR